MINKVLYLYPEFEGQQYFICWGFAKNSLPKNTDEAKIRGLVLKGLEDISKESNRWVSMRSFSVYLGEDAKNFWVAVPRQLPAKSMKILSNRLSALDSKIVITSFENPFGEKLPFGPVISYDRGFIFDSTNIEAKFTQSLKGEKAVNI
ncbi:MAG: hypothetical protein ACOYVD_10885 [Bacillota bacterium]